MSDDTTVLARFVIPSSGPLFLSIVAVHILLGIASAAEAMGIRAGRLP
jgi:hypothetical protein